MELIKSVNEALQNAERFNQLNEDSESKALERFSMFFHWYYFPDQDIFAPSKFIGYKNSTIKNYQGGGTGTETQRLLKKCGWFLKLDPSSSKHKRLKAKLEEFADCLGKNIGVKTFKGTGGIYELTK